MMHKHAEILHKHAFGIFLFFRGLCKPNKHRTRIETEGTPKGIM